MELHWSDETGEVCRCGLDDFMQPTLCKVPIILEISISKKWFEQEVSMALKIGDMAPDFTLKSHTGLSVSLRDFRGKNVVMAFFPLAWTPV